MGHSFSKLTGLLLAAATMFFAACSERRQPRQEFVHMQDGRFMLNGSEFHPLVLNYIMPLRTNGMEVWAAPYPGYTPGRRFPYRDKDSSLLAIRSDFAMIRSMGFNTVRLVKFAEGPARNRITGELFLRAFLHDGRDTLLPLEDRLYRDRHLEAVKEVAAMAREEGLHIILLTMLRPNEANVEVNWQHLAAGLRNETAILAYDLFNEPLYFDSIARSKTEVHKIVKGWRRLMQDHAPDHLFTLGLQGMGEVFAWDPNMLDVDFISFHPYEYEPEQVRNEMRWYHDHVRVPWIIGETSLPADGDSIPYSRQLEFARETLRQTAACGGIGYSWWNYKDVDWGEFHSNYMGLLTLDGTTHPAGAPLPVAGTTKAAVDAFMEYDPSAPAGECLKLPNYYNYSDHRTSILTGKLMNEKGEPIAGGVVIGWNEHFSHSYRTTTRADGTFQLQGDLYFHHWMASATCHEMVRGHCRPDGYLTRAAGMPEFFLGHLVLQRLTDGCLAQGLTS